MEALFTWTPAGHDSAKLKQEVLNSDLKSDSFNEIIIILHSFKSCRIKLLQTPNDGEYGEILLHYYILLHSSS